MPQNIFSRQIDLFGGAYAADGAEVTFPMIGAQDGGDIGMLLQQLQASFQQQFTRLYEISSNRVYYVTGRASGMLQAQRVAGPRKLAVAFYQRYGNVCNAKNNLLSYRLSAGCDQSVREYAQYTMYFCVITSVQIGQNAADLTVNEGYQQQFASLVYS